MANVSSAFDICNRLNENASVTQSDLVNMRCILNDLDMERQLAEEAKTRLEAELKSLKARDADRRIADLEERLKRSDWLKESYSETVDKAMKCVEAVIAAVCGASKDEIKGAGAPFFVDATVYLTRKIESHVNYVKSMSSTRKLEEAEAFRDKMREERNAAVRKQLDHEQTISKLTERVKWFESNDQLKIAEQRAVRISELGVELDKALKQASEAQARADANGHRAQEAIKQIGLNETVALATIGRFNDERAELKRRISYLESISPGADSDAVSALVRECMHLMTPSARDNRRQAVQAVMGLALQYPRLSKDFEAVSAANEKHLKWLAAVGKHLQLEPSQWWEQHDAVERLRTRVEWLRDGNTKAIATLKGEVERLTDVIYELRKGT